MKKPFAYLIFALCAVLVVSVAYVNVDALVGAFGAGSPYYGRTTNMDKWENPIPTLVVIDAMTLVLVSIIVRWARRQISRER